MTEQPGLFDELLPTHPNTLIDPDRVTVDRIPQSLLVSYQSKASKAVWRPAPGRKNSYAVHHDGQVIGLMFLASPVINLGVRDEYLKLPKEGRGYVLRTVADMSVCVGFQPLAWHWNIGKLIAMLATCNEIADEHTNSYGDELDWITTTSLYGRGAQYNRVYKFLGYTKGYGHAHVSETEYQGMLSWMRENKVPIPSAAFGAGSNPRMRRIAAYQRATGKRVNLKHGDKRGVYISPARQGTVSEITRRWFNRWGLPRYERTLDRTPPYTTGLEA